MPTPGRRNPTPFPLSPAIPVQSGFERVMSPMKIHDRILVGDVVQMRKPHACGGDVWTVYRVGADIGMDCRTCGRRTMLTRRRFTHRMRRMLERGPERPAEGQGRHDSA